MNLGSLPDDLFSLTNLKRLYLSHNKITELPPQLAQLHNLEEIHLNDNPLHSPPSEVINQGTAAILAFLRGRGEKTERQWVSKLLIVGEGGVGKTQLLRQLRLENFDPSVPTTHGIQIRACHFRHPSNSDVRMTLNAWDFGGQQIYHATHQFFLTNRSLFLLAWNARLGYEQGRLYYWLDTIRALAPDSPVLLVATHTDEREPDIPIAQLTVQYKQLIGQIAVSNRTGDGIAELSARVAALAARLPLMGEAWPATWLRAAQMIRELTAKSITPAELSRLIEECGVAPEGVPVLTRWLHELGDLLYFPDDDELRDTIILQPQWVSEYIGKALVSEDVIQRNGVFTADEMARVWSDLGADTRNRFLRLMERFDLSYRTLENRDVSLIVERLPLDPPAFEQLWSAARDQSGNAEVAMRFSLGVLPAGIPTWFIARAHRFTTYTHWRSGAIFSDSNDRKHLALIRADAHQKRIDLAVRGPYPHDFFALLRDGLELTLARFPGLNVRRTIPCTGHNGQTCEHEFDAAHLTKAVARKPPVLEIQCPLAFEMVSIPGLLFGIHWSTQGAIIDRIDQLQSQLSDDLNELKRLVQREFLKLFEVDQQNVDIQCPNLFILRPVKGRRWSSPVIGTDVELHLYCQAPGEWHPADSSGRYVYRVLPEWLHAVSPYIGAMVKVLKYAAPLAGATIAMLAPEIEATIKSDIALMQELVKALPSGSAEIEPNTAAITPEPKFAEGAALRAIRSTLDALDPAKLWGGLSRILTPEGHYMWLCRHHAKTVTR